MARWNNKNCGFQKSHIAWNKDLTKETDERIFKMSETQSKTKKRLYKEGVLTTCYKKGNHPSPKTEFKEGYKFGNIFKKGEHPSPKTEFKKGNTFGFKKGHKPYLKGLVGRIKSDKEIQKSLETRKNHGGYPIGEKHQMFGKKHKEESKIKMKISHIKYMKENNINLLPNQGKYEKEILDKLQDMIGFSIKRNFYINGYYLDGYCQEINLAIEVDEEYHFSNDKIKQKDLIRQNEIIKLLNCNFLRIREKEYISKCKDLVIPNTLLIKPLSIYGGLL